MNRRNALFAGHDEGGRSWARMASLIGSAKMNGVDPYAYLLCLFTRLARGHLNKDIDAMGLRRRGLISLTMSSSGIPQ